MNITNIKNIEGIDYLVYEHLNYQIDKIVYFKSGWGNEYIKVTQEFERSFLIEETLGRSSATFHPYIIIIDKLGNTHNYSIGYSSNWKIEITKDNYNTTLKINLGDESKINDDLFIPKVFYGNNFINNVDDSNLKTELLDFPLIYNHWWAYEDSNINEEIFIENAKIAKEIGIDYCILDAGWFGNEEGFMDSRADWDVINNKRFPNGIKYLSDVINDLDMKFGLWIEIESIGNNALIRNSMANYISNGDENLLCFGNNFVQEWAISTISSLIINYNVSWLKMDFNISPKISCNNINHDHNKFDGNQAHISGLYKVISKLKQVFPKVIFENCSSGGLRSDQQIISLFDVNFLSDVDYLSHKIRCFKNSKQFIPNYKNFHFIPSMCVHELDSGFISTNFSKMEYLETRYNLISALFGLTGISHRLVDYNSLVIKELKQFFSIYKNECKHFLRINECELIDNNNYTMIIYKNKFETLVGIMAHNAIDIKLDGFNHTDLFANEKISNQLCLQEKSGYLIKYIDERG